MFARRSRRQPSPTESLRSDAPAAAGATRLEERLAHVERELAAVAGDRSLCDLSASGPTGQVKRWEGAMAALLELRRAHRRQPDRPLAELTGEVLAAWRAELEAARGPVWEAYRRGGVDELEALAGELA